ncbi:BgTH12-05597 [Blumeria graminis f. sp. triticale]|uniref:3-phytase n=3 Tax=Blumeria graminis TaxID=34373 RepID=A0A061HM60_BLUGR|nr:hypothetical protein BGT96224_842 [Blumeria graminis f. sp. tritici 96224]CAD6503852.1 BgTH12-05597 [Blumeria graminis f. sp. triticale]VDB90532.1 Bgt-842 [Blumeria graminis f. sp. tritici]
MLMQRGEPFRTIILAFAYISVMLFLVALLVQQPGPITALLSVKSSEFPISDTPSQEDNIIPNASSVITSIPQYFQTTPELWAGPTATGMAPFLAQTNPVSFTGTATFVPNTPLETAYPIAGAQQNQNVFQLMGHLSPYFPNINGFGVHEYPLPLGARITQAQMLSRHGSRYPTSSDLVNNFAQKLANKTIGFKANGALQFLNNWKFNLGSNILVPRGRQELFESGILHYYQYGQLYNPNSKIIARTTTQDRMLKSAEYFLAGFFGLEWTQNATIEVIIEANGYNNSLAGSESCHNAKNFRNDGGKNASSVWVGNYLQNATSRFQSMLEGIDWNVTDTFAAQTLCPYETVNHLVAFGYSAFCDLFTYEEWEGFEYAQDLYFAGSSSFQSPTGRAVGLGYVQETIARLQNHTLGYSGSQINVTLDNNTDTFPLDQSLYFDFSHDTNMMSILTSFGFRQFNELLPLDHHPGAHNLTASHLEPFAARLDIEIIKTPFPLSAQRIYNESGNETTYVHFLLNQRTLPLGVNFPDCGINRLDGWCELETFLKVQEDTMKFVEFEYACNGEYEAPAWGEITDGVPKN